MPAPGDIITAFSSLSDALDAPLPPRFGPPTVDESPHGRTSGRREGQGLGAPEDDELTDEIRRFLAAYVAT